MKKLLLILILLLTFTLIGNCDWLAGWDYRIEIAIGNYAGDIGASVTHFPVTVFLTDSQCEEIFTELTTDAEYLKTAVTKSDGTTEMYAEFEIFDVSETKGIFHTSKDDWTIDANTKIYLYYDKDHADNIAYIGAITARTEVWDGSTEGHWDMAQDPDGDGANAIKDSTSNTRHLTPAGTMLTEDLVDGKIGKAIYFDGSDDYLEKASADTGIANAWTLSWCDNVDDAPAAQNCSFNIQPADWNYSIEIYIESNLHWRVRIRDNAENFKQYVYETGASTATWYHRSVTWDGTNLKLYLNGTELTVLNKLEDDSLTMANVNRMIKIGTHLAYGKWDGMIDEPSYASVTRSAAWIKGLYNSAWDTLLTYGSEESAPGITWNDTTVSLWNTITPAVLINTQ